MRKIAILDDRAPQRETLRTLIDTVLPKGWECIACPLLKSVNEYPNWLIDKDVQVLLADQVLNEQAAEVGSQLDTLGELSKKVAAGTDTATDRKKLRALQTFIGLGVERPSDKTRAELLRSLETKLDELDAVRGKIEKFLGKKPKK